MSTRPLFQTLLGPDFEKLPTPVRRLHSAVAPLSLVGAVKVRLGAGFWPRLIRFVGRLPRPGDDLPAAVTIVPDGRGRERWRRRFGGDRYAGTLRAGTGATAGLLIDRLGPFSFHFHLTPSGLALVWTCVGWRFLGVPLPPRTTPNIVCSESAEGQEYRFEISAAFPLVGMVFQYRGWLIEEPPI